MYIIHQINSVAFERPLVFFHLCFLHFWQSFIDHFLAADVMKEVGNCLSHACKLAGQEVWLDLPLVA